MKVTVSQRLSKLSNDYTELEKKFFNETGNKLSLDITSAPPNIQARSPLSVSIIVPGWNVSNSILACLTAIEQSSFNLKYPELLQVVFIDDSSTDNTWEIVNSSSLSLNITSIRIDHAGQAQAMNAGLSIANGDIVISCDADMVLNHYTIEHLVVRHQILPNVLLVGFRSNITKNDPQINPMFIRKYGVFCENDLTDERIVFPIPGWPSNMCLISSHFKRLGYGHSLLMPGDLINDPWILPDMVFGALFSLSRKTFLKVGGYDERFKGWGCTDTYLAAKAIAAENLQVIPVYSASGLHISHPFRTKNKEFEYASNRKLFKHLIKTECIDKFPDFVTPAKTRIKDSFTKSCKKIDATTTKFISKNKLDKTSNIINLLLIGEYSEALKLLLKDINLEKNSEHFCQLGDALFGLNRFQEAVDAFQRASEISNIPEKFIIKLAIAQAADGQFLPAHQIFKKLSHDYPYAQNLYYWCHNPVKFHIMQGKKYFNQKYYDVALRCFEAALIIEPSSKESLQLRFLSKNKTDLL